MTPPHLPGTTGPGKLSVTSASLTPLSLAGAGPLLQADVSFYESRMQDFQTPWRPIGDHNKYYYCIDLPNIYTNIK